MATPSTLEKLKKSMEIHGKSRKSKSKESYEIHGKSRKNAKRKLKKTLEKVGEA